MAGNKRGDHTSINNEDAYKRSMDSIREKLTHWRPPYLGGCIYRVPENLRKVNEKAYTPQIVSIGPFHRDNQNLKDMEKHKVQYMLDLRDRMQEPETIFDDCGKAIWRLKERISNSYAETINFESNDFLEMMLLDGCFILELLLKYSDVRLIDKDDPLFNKPWMIIAIGRDLLLLENQIPFTILESLYDRLTVGVMSPSTSDSLLELTFYFFQSILGIKCPLSNSECELLSGKHFLDLLRKFYLPSSTEMGSKSRETLKTIPCATDLKLAGIDFKEGIDGNFFNASFIHGVLTIPPLSIQDKTESFFRNLIAWEQCCHGMDHYITSYVMFMDFLINSTQDVKLLQGQRIIINHLGDEEAVSVLFNNLCKEVTITGFYYTELFDQVDEYFQKRRHKWKATLKRNHCSNPWKIISLIGAIILLILTIAQTVFSGLSYYSPN